MKAITTRYISPTNYRPARVKATAEELSITVSWDHALNVERNHLAAAQALAHKMDWSGRWVGGGTVHGYAFVNVDRAFGAEFEVKRNGP